MSSNPQEPAAYTPSWTLVTTASRKAEAQAAELNERRQEAERVSHSAMQVFFWIAVGLSALGMYFNLRDLF